MCIGSTKHNRYIYIIASAYQYSKYKYKTGHQNKVESNIISTQQRLSIQYSLYVHFSLHNCTAG